MRNISISRKRSPAPIIKAPYVGCYGTTEPHHWVFECDFERIESLGVCKKCSATTIKSNMEPEMGASFKESHSLNAPSTWDWMRG